MNKRNILIFGIMLIVLTSFVSATNYVLCYQEFANVSTDCGGLGNGTYEFNGTWTNPNNAIDGDWTTYGTVGAGSPFLLINLTKPFGTVGATWKSGYSTAVTNNVSNIIPSDCLSQNPIQLNWSKHPSPDHINSSCYNGTNWIHLDNTGGGDFFREEAIEWNLSDITNLNLTFRDETTNTKITDETFTVYLEKSGFSQTYSANSSATNPYSIPNLEVDLYTQLKVSSTNYPEKQYLSIDLRDGNRSSPVDFTVYLINTTDGSEITFNVLDSNSENIEDVSIDFYRTINGTSTQVAQEQTDYGGKSRLYLDTNYEYTINFSKTDYLTKTINLEPTVADSPYTIYLDDETAIIPPLAVAYTIRRIFREGETFNLTYTNSTQVVHFEWHDETSYVDNMCLNVYDTNQSFYLNCSTLNVGYMDYTITKGNRTYIAKAWANKDNRDYTLKIININLLEVITKLGKDVVIISWIVFLTLAFIGLAKPYVSLFLSVFGLIGMYLIGMLPIGFGTIMGILSVAVIISMGIRRSRRQ